MYMRSVKEVLSNIPEGLNWHPVGVRITITRLKHLKLVYSLKVNINTDLPSEILRKRRLDNYYHFYRNHKKDPRDLFNYNPRKDRDFKCEFKLSSTSKIITTNGMLKLSGVINKDIKHLHSIGIQYTPRTT